MDIKETDNQDRIQTNRKSKGDRRWRILKSAWFALLRAIPTMIVLFVIFFILTLIAIPNFISLRARSYNASSKSAGRNLALALQYIQNENPSYAYNDDTNFDGPTTDPLNAEGYDDLVENEFSLVADSPLSTFSIDVDTASYSNIRRILKGGSMPPAGAVRLEEMINYFPYDYPQPNDNEPFAVHAESASTPWVPSHRLVRIALKGREIPMEDVPPLNLVFLIDVSGSMQADNKLPLVMESLELLVDELRREDKVAIVVYAGREGLVLPSTPGSKKYLIRKALRNLRAGGSTNGSGGIKLAYRIAKENLIQEGINRVVLATDGDFNVGTVSRSGLKKLIENKSKSGIFLTVLGYGMGNLKDSQMEMLADKGNGNYAYVDDLTEAQKVLVEQLTGTLATIAKDVKIQVEFNPAQVKRYRLIGYENRLLKDTDFNDDEKDAGEIGAGHTVTAFYEIITTKSDVSGPSIDPLKYQENRKLSAAAENGELLTLKLRYKQPDGHESQLLSYTVFDDGKSFHKATRDFRFASSVALFGMLLRDSQFVKDMTYRQVLRIAKHALGKDENGYREEFMELIRIADTVSINDQERRAQLEKVREKVENGLSADMVKEDMLNLLLAYDPNLTDDPDVTFEFLSINSTGYTFRTSHARRKAKEYTFKGRWNK